MATLGNTTVGSSYPNVGNPRIAVLPAMPENGTLESITFMLRYVRTSDRAVKFGLLADDGTLLSMSDTYSGSEVGATATNITLNISGGFSLVEGTNYKLIVIAQWSGTTAVRNDSAVTNAGGYASGASAWPTEDASYSFVNQDYEYTAYLTYTPATIPNTSTYDVDLSEKAGYQTLQVKIADADTVNGLFASDVITVEDDMEVTVETVKDGVTINLSSDGNISVDKTELDNAGGSITLNPEYFSPSTTNISVLPYTFNAPPPPPSGGQGSNMTKWIELNGAGGQTNEAWMAYMEGQGAVGSTFNERMYDWLGGLGYTGSLSERVAAWAKTNLN